MRILRSCYHNVVKTNRDPYSSIDGYLAHQLLSTGLKDRH